MNKKQFICRHGDREDLLEKTVEWREEGLLCRAMRRSLGTLASHKADHTRGLANFWMHGWMGFGSLLSLERPRGDWHLVFYTWYLMPSPVPRWLWGKDKGSLLVDGWTSLVAFLVGISRNWILRFNCQLNKPQISQEHASQSVLCSFVLTTLVFL